MGLLDALSNSTRKVETLPLMFALSTSANPWELPAVTSGKSQGANMITVNQLEKRLKGFVPSESVKQTRGSHLTDLSAYPGIKNGETIWDWLQRTDDFGSNGQGFQEVKEAITRLQADPDAVSDKHVLLNGVMTSTENAERIMSLSEDELKAELSSDRALSDKRKEEEVVNAQNVKDAQVEARRSLDTPRRSNSRVGESTTIRTEVAEDGTETHFIIGAESGDSYGNPEGYSDLGLALAEQQQVTGGSTPSVKGRPDLFATQPLQAEVDAGLNGATVADFTGAVTDNVAELEEAAIAEDPGLIVTAEMRAEWLAQAVDMLSPFYTEAIRNLKEVYGIEIGRLIEDVRTSETALAQQYRKGLRNLQSDLRDRGMLFGGIRGQEEGELAAETNTLLEGLERTFARGLQDIATADSDSVEQKLGTEQAQEFERELDSSLGEIDLVGRVLPGSPELTPSEGNADLLDLRGGLTGEAIRERKEEESLRAGELESSFLAESTRTL